MLRPKYLDALPDSLVELYAQAEMDIMQDMAQRMLPFDDFIPSAQWQYEKLIAMGNYHSHVVKTLSSLTGKTGREVQDIMTRSGLKTLQFDDAIYSMAGLDPPPLAASPRLRAILADGIRATNGLFQNLTHSTAKTATQQFEQALDRAWLNIHSGAISHTEATRRAIQELSRDGIHAIRYSSGRVDRLDVAVRRAVLTGVNQTALRLQLTRAEEMGCDLVETSAHSGARPDHALWQGRVFSRSGAHKKYLPFAESTGYGTGAGLGGWNCRHSVFPFYDGISEPAYTAKELAELEAPLYTYNCKSLTEYEATQIQRKNERNIRAWRREVAALKAAGLDTGDAQAKLTYWMDKQKDFLAQTGLKRQFDREQVEDAPKPAVAKSADGGILNSISRTPLPVTQEAIDRVPTYPSTLLDANGQTVLQEAHKDLLRTVADQPPGTEAIAYYDMGMKLITKCIGGKYAVKQTIVDKPHIVAHNHPHGETFSMSDLRKTMLNKSMNIITAVGNDGSIYALEKTDHSDAHGLFMYVNNALSGLPNPATVEVAVKTAEAIDRALRKGAVQYGYRYYTRG